MDETRNHRLPRSEAASYLRSALARHDIPAVLELLPGLTGLLGPYVPMEDAHIAPSLKAAVRARPAAARMEIADALLAECEGRDRRDPGLHSAQLAMDFLIGGMAPADLAPVAERWFGFVARHDVYFVWEPLAALIQERLDRGETVPGLVVGVMRRSALVSYFDHTGTGGLRKFADSLTEPPLNPGEAWSDRVLADLEAVPADGVAPGPWRRVVAHAATATTAKPSKAWEKTARALLAELGEDLVRARLLEWLAPVGLPRTVAVVNTSGNGPDTKADEYDPFNVDILRGLTWLLGFAAPGVDSARALGRVVETSLCKLPGLGQRCVKAANAAVYALSRQEGDPALAELARLSIAVTYKGTLKEIGKAVEERAAARGLTTDEVEELSVPTHGLTAMGRRVEVFGDAEAELTVAGTSVVWTWRAAGGRVVKSAPAKVRAEYGSELKELKADAAALAKTLSAHSERLDRQFLARRAWRHDEWRARLADHVLLGTLVRRLIWLVDGTPVFFDGLEADAALRTVDGVAVAPGPDASVELWHPVGRDLSEVLAWRLRLEESGSVQPFKQAHREVYPLTPAEEETRVYSNRFAAQILRQHQFQALAALRGWHSKLRLAVDDSLPPAVKHLPLWDLRAEFWIDGVEGDDWNSYTVAGSGAYAYLATDQVRFYRHGAAENTAQLGTRVFHALYQEEQPQPVPLSEVPPLVLSEVLRDVDLFVGVAGVGNDPTWADGGPGGRFRGYWRDYAFGELSVSAQSRAELLARILPRLAVADRCRIDGRFLVVRGELNTYKIHLGSGNILMEPGDRYLCIVPGRGDGEADGASAALPFEGDRVLAVLLSKALLLADDAAITDPTIVRQLREGD